MATLTVPRNEDVSATVPLMGLGFATMSERETIDYVLEGAAEDRGGWVCPVNLDVLRQWRRSEEIQELVSRADLVVADGMPLLWAAGVQGSRLPERVSGSALIVSLTAAAAAAGLSIFLLGGNPGVADVALERLTELCPELDACGSLCPPFGFEDDPEWLDRIEESVQAAAPDIVYVGLGFPKQERLIVELRKRLPQTWFISCGIAFSFVSGEIRRAPAVLQRLGLEWLHRLTQEPRRLYRRYLLHGIPFLIELLWFSLSNRRGSSVGIVD
jgi:N-acetylglucosaminyldiphosphoundecaprenol N-acetyl-beta-D-mannosaminyltransferase